MTLPEPDVSLPPRRLEVAYLVSQYPAPSHVFIEREIQGLRRLGHRVETFSVRPTPSEQLLTDTMVNEATRTVALLASRGQLSRDMARGVLRHPAGVAAAARRALGTGEPYGRTRLKQLFYMAEAVSLHRAMVRRGLRHIHVHFSNNGADVARLAVALGRAVDGPGSGWGWTMTVHGPTEFEAVDRVDLAAKVAHAEGVACISDFARSQIMRLIPPAQWSKLHRVNMSVDTDVYAPSAFAPREDRPFRVLYVGRLVPEKGATVLIEALRQMKDAGHSVEAKLVGSGSFGPVVEESIETAGLGRSVLMTGPLGQDALPSLYRWCDAFCLPSFQEGLPVVLMEAMASGRPVVTTTVAGIPELVRDGVNGRLVSAGRPDMIADALRSLLLSEDLDDVGAAGRATIAGAYDVETAAGQQASFLRRYFTAVSG